MRLEIPRGGKTSKEKVEKKRFKQVNPKDLSSGETIKEIFEPRGKRKTTEEET